MREQRAVQKRWNLWSSSCRRRTCRNGSDRSLLRASSAETETLLHFEARSRRTARSRSSHEPTIRVKPLSRHQIRNNYSEHWRDLFRPWLSIWPYAYKKIVATTLWAVLVCCVFLIPVEAIKRLPPPNLCFVTVVSSVVGLLVSFGTSHSYDRWHEALKLFSNLHYQTINTARLIAVYFDAEAVEGLRESTLKLLIGFAYATKHRLRAETSLAYPDIRHYIEHVRVPPGFKCASGVVPLDIVTALQSYVELGCALCPLVSSVPLYSAISSLEEAFIQLDRIKATPIPYAYRIHLSQSVLLYLFGIPFCVIQDLRWLTPFVSFITAFLLIGTIEVGAKIEQPFGYDRQGADIDAYAECIKERIEELLDRESVRKELGWAEPIICETVEGHRFLHRTLIHR
ncbi:Bestrophin, RFP-TM, chloride channel-domain-containing protein [Chytriomyces sp. MP71]|nr:Bestrophin, RFP-TM, chloride channel-domain-containing protein [Chytriomyces sp. MP71]